MQSAIDNRLIRILLVEDNPGDVLLAVEALQDAQVRAEIRVASDGASALAMLRALPGATPLERPDLILLDLNMPRKSGFEVLEELKRDADLRQIPVIVLSSSKAARDVWKSYDLHANCYLAKPISHEQYVRLVRFVSEFWCPNEAAF